MKGEMWYYIDEREDVAAGFTLSKQVLSHGVDVKRIIRLACGGALAEAQLEIAERFDPLTRAVFWGPWRKKESDHVYEYRIDGTVYAVPICRNVYVMPENLRSRAGFRPIASSELRRGWGRVLGDKLEIYTGDVYGGPLTHSG